MFAGSVAAYKAIELTRLLMRHGADVTCVASNAVTKINSTKIISNGQQEMMS